MPTREQFVEWGKQGYKIRQEQIAKMKADLEAEGDGNAALRRLIADEKQKKDVKAERVLSQLPYSLLIGCPAVL
jgi:hypothetical protein